MGKQLLLGSNSAEMRLKQITNLPYGLAFTLQPLDMETPGANSSSDIPPSTLWAGRAATAVPEALLLLLCPHFPHTRLQGRQERPGSNFFPCSVVAEIRNELLWT